MPLLPRWILREERSDLEFLKTWGGRGFLVIFLLFGYFFIWLGGSGFLPSFLIPFD